MESITRQRAGNALCNANPAAGRWFVRPARAAAGSARPRQPWGGSGGSSPPASSTRCPSVTERTHGQHCVPLGSVRRHRASGKAAFPDAGRGFWGQSILPRHPSQSCPKASEMREPFAQRPKSKNLSPGAKWPVSTPAPSSALPPASAPAPRAFAKEAAPLAREEESFISKTQVRFANQDYKERGEKKKPATTLSSKC